MPTKQTEWPILQTKKAVKAHMGALWSLVGNGKTEMLFDRKTVQHAEALWRYAEWSEGWGWKRMY